MPVKYYLTKKRKVKLVKQMVLFYSTLALLIVIVGLFLTTSDEVLAESPEAVPEPVTEVLEPETTIISDDRIPIAEALTMLPESKPMSVEEQIRRLADEVCEGADYCINDLVAIAWVETRFNCESVGDNGNSYGCYQIHRGYHPSVSSEQAVDLKFAIPWTYNRLVAHGYPEYRSYAIRKHNGGATNPLTLVYLNKVNAYLGL